ncbi:MAG: HlyD family type I secretion periplasmic adaptor subunit [Burkholderiaceae bacterium]
MKPRAPATGRAARPAAPVVEFLPDADEIERRPLPPYVRLTLHTLVAMLLAFILWATFSRIDRVVVAHGKLITPLPNIVMQPLETSIIKSIDVRVGQLVKKGQHLATLDPTFTQADQAQLRTQLRSLETQAQRLQQEIAGNGARAPVDSPAGDADAQLQAQLATERQANYRAQRTRMEENIAKLRAGLETNRRDQQLLTERVASLREMENMQQKLVAQNFGAKLKLLEAQDKRQEVEREQQLARNREQELKRELASFEADKAAFDRSWRQKAMEDMLSTTRDRNTVSEQLRKADQRQKLVTLIAPADAVVLDIAKLSQGSVIKEAEPLFTLVPLNAELEAEVQIDSQDVGYVKLNDPVYLKLDAFPFQQHGALHGQVRTLSGDAFRRDTAGNPAAMGQGTDAFYLSRIRPDGLRLKKMPSQARLLPGMTLSAEIVVGQRSVMSYLLWPLTKALHESLNEP